MTDNLYFLLGGFIACGVMTCAFVLVVIAAIIYTRKPTTTGAPTPALAPVPPQFIILPNTHEAVQARSDRKHFVVQSFPNQVEAKVSELEGIAELVGVYPNALVKELSDVWFRLVK